MATFRLPNGRRAEVDEFLESNVKRFKSGIKGRNFNLKLSDGSVASLFVNATAEGADNIAFGLVTNPSTKLVAFFRVLGSESPVEANQGTVGLTQNPKALSEAIVDPRKSLAAHSNYIEVFDRGSRPQQLGAAPADVKPLLLDAMAVLEGLDAWIGVYDSKASQAKRAGEKGEDAAPKLSREERREQLAAEKERRVIESKVAPAPESKSAPVNVYAELRKSALEGLEKYGKVRAAKFSSEAAGVKYVISANGGNIKISVAAKDMDPAKDGRKEVRTTAEYQCIDRKAVKLASYVGIARGADKNLVIPSEAGQTPYVSHNTSYGKEGVESLIAELKSDSSVGETKFLIRSYKRLTVLAEAVAEWQEAKRVESLEARHAREEEEGLSRSRANHPAMQGRGEEAIALEESKKRHPSAKNKTTIRLRYIPVDAELESELIRKMEESYKSYGEFGSFQAAASGILSTGSYRADRTFLVNLEIDGPNFTMSHSELNTGSDVQTLRFDTKDGKPYTTVIFKAEDNDLVASVLGSEKELLSKELRMYATYISALQSFDKFA